MKTDKDYMDKMLNYVHVSAPTKEDMEAEKAKLKKAVNEFLSKNKEFGKMESKKNLARELKELLNRHSVENDSNTPDFILATYLLGCLKIWKEKTPSKFVDLYCKTLEERSDWHNGSLGEKSVHLDVSDINDVADFEKVVDEISRNLKNSNPSCDEEK